MEALEFVETEVPVSDLQLGMHVLRLDCDWESTDFPLQGFIIRCQEDIHALQEQCTSVFIEGRVTYQSRHTSSSLFRKTKAAAPVRRVTYINKIPFRDELDAAMASFHACRNLAKDILTSVRLGRVIDLNEVRPVVKGVVNSVIRNQAALLWLTQIRNKDDYTAEHCMNVCVLSAAFGRHLGIEGKDLEVLALAGLLHDVGKIKVDDAVLNKPGAYTPEEFAEMKMHPVYGRQVLMAVNGLESTAVDVAYDHHERMDGTGYPRGLLQHQIPYFAKIVAVVDAYDAITGHRVYDSAKSSKQALDILYKCRGTQFDDDLALEFIRFTGIYPPGALVELSTGEIGLILQSNPVNRLRPRLLVVRDAGKAPCRERVLDLMSLNIGDGKPVTVLKEWPNGSFGIDLKHYLELGLQLRKEAEAGGQAESDVLEYFT
ncbi:HD-GYP domain-containing protein [Marinobacter salicampi]|uniref:HD-GYP domain-containing protein n=1 Tax=Marinobacter salicampi TaxID=435907 RepID=UPI001F5FB2E0|nr:HD-GYP domain-containing protein [Marinobacter salicampi]